MLTIVCGGVDRPLNGYTGPSRLYVEGIENGSAVDAEGRYLNLVANSTLEIAGRQPAVELARGNTYYEFSEGSHQITIVTNLRLTKKDSAAVPASSIRPEGWRGITWRGALGAIGYDANFYQSHSVFYLGNLKSVSATCDISSSPAVVTLPKVLNSRFIGVGTTQANTPFMVSANCSSVAATTKVGVSFSSDAQDASGAAGVIRTSQGNNQATGVGLQIINATTNQPILFDEFERGTPRRAGFNGIYPFPFQVRYFQTSNQVTQGLVNGRVVVSVVYQ